MGHARGLGWQSGLCLAIGLGWLLTLHITFSLPNVTALKYETPSQSAFMLWERLRHPLRPIAQEWVPLPHIADSLERAVVAAEDDGFFSHPGYDWAAIKKAARYNWKKRAFARGASTITQQLARNLYLSRVKMPTRKVKELLIALKLERELTKERILELYLNFAEWGPGIFGCQAAARYYFRVPCERLTTAQSAFLASILPNPKKYGKRGFRMSSRAQRILQQM
ncbi:MAG: monofunctional biosynthetic peptidoglycan transglycosylase [Deltaproteobacteria bacterium]|nr:monofunctional biosynthetic peptidoglycan transglycosylase [Deltaproteobacteria bacterium]